MKLRTCIHHDDRPVRDELAVLCATRGHEVVTFADPALCPRHAESRCPCPSGTRCADFVICGVDPPASRALDLVSSRQAQRCGMPRFALISDAWSELDRARAVALGCHLISRPRASLEIIRWLHEVELCIPPERRLADWSGGTAGGAVKAKGRSRRPRGSA